MWVLKQHANRYVDLENTDSAESICFCIQNRNRRWTHVFVNSARTALNICYSGGREMGKITSGRQLLKYAKREESINRVPHPCYLPLALLRIWVDLN